MSEIAMELVAIERPLWEGTVSIMTADTTEGEIGVCPGHQPMLAQLAPDGIVTITPIEGEKMVAAVYSGFLSVSRDKITILADEAIWSTEIDEEAAKQGAEDKDPQVAWRNKGYLKAIRRAKETS